MLTYQLYIRCLGIGIHLYSLFNKQAAKWMQGRRNWRETFFSETEKLHGCIWFHAASLGEYEQARIVIEKTQKQLPNKPVVVSFFSPSGFEILKKKNNNFHLVYLPLDTKSNARWLIKNCRPSQILFIKYDLWWNFIRVAMQNGVAVHFFSAHFKQGNYLFKWYGKPLLNKMKRFSGIYTLTEADTKKLADKNIAATTCGDPRIDGLLALKKEPYANALIQQFCQNQPVWICGSTWPADINLIRHCIADWEGKIIIAPHKIDKYNIGHIKNNIKENTGLYSDGEKASPGKKILIIDNIGILKYIYRYADIAYVGGGFGSGIHNLLEPAVFGLPVVFGPNYKGFMEAFAFIEMQVGISVKNSRQLADAIKILMKNKANIKQKSKKWFASQTQASDLLAQAVVKTAHTQEKL